MQKLKQQLSRLSSASNSPMNKIESKFDKGTKPGFSQTQQSVKKIMSRFSGGFSHTTSMKIIETYKNTTVYHGKKKGLEAPAEENEPLKQNALVMNFQRLKQQA